VSLSPRGRWFTVHGSFGSLGAAGSHGPPPVVVTDSIRSSPACEPSCRMAVDYSGLRGLAFAFALLHRAQNCSNGPEIKAQCSIDWRDPLGPFPHDTGYPPGPLPQLFQSSTAHSKRAPRAGGLGYSGPSTGTVLATTTKICARRHAPAGGGAPAGSAVSSALS
jgi:hypothetical protein